MILKLAFLLSSLLPHVDPDLRQEFIQAATSWLPFVADVSEVRYCDWTECLEMQEMNHVGQWWTEGKRILVRPDYNFPPGGRLATLAHEYGHALGLEHSQDYSVMRDSWELPWPVAPTAADFAALGVGQ